MTKRETIDKIRINNVDYQIGQRQFATDTLKNVVIQATIDDSFSKEIAFANTTDYGPIALFGLSISYYPDGISFKSASMNFISKDGLFNVEYGGGSPTKITELSSPSIEDVTDYNALNSAFSSFMHNRYTYGNKKTPVRITLSSPPENWKGLSYNAPTGEAFAFYSNYRVVLITSVGLVSLTAAGESNYLSPYNNANSGLDATSVQEAIDELANRIIKTTYSKLKSLRDASKLVGGQQYRITDYQCTTTQENTSSGGHQFDIIVVADNTNTLNENARAVLHEGDTYFDDCNLEAWEIKYCLDNDTTRFAWADSTNGKGVIYYMKDEFGNECPYDFKNIQFTKSGEYVYTFTYAISGENGYEFRDASILASQKTTDNVIKEYRSGNLLRLNFIVFSTTESVLSCENNIFGFDCWNNTFGARCSDNTFANDCFNNTFGNDCQYTITLDLFEGNTFGDGCVGNTFKYRCRFNSLSGSSNYNRFEDSCAYNTINGRYNIFGHGCTYNTLNESNSNVFHSGCTYNTIENGTYNTIGDRCQNNILYNECKHITLQADATYNNIYGVARNTDNPYRLDGDFLTIGAGCRRLNIYSDIQQNYSTIYNGYQGTETNYLDITIDQRYMIIYPNDIEFKVL